MHNTQNKAKPWYSLSGSHPAPPPPTTSIPATIVIDPLYGSDLFQIQISPNVMPTKTMPTNQGLINITGDSITPQHELNSIADERARGCDSHRCTESTILPVPRPTSKVELIHNNQIVSSRLLQLAKDAVHRTPLHLYTVRHAGWPPTTFDCMDWNAHKQAIKHYSRVKWLSISKLAHGLHHTNY